MRPTRNERRYSITWIRSSQPAGGGGSLRRPGRGHRGAVDCADRASGTDHPVGIVDERLDDSQQRISVEQGVRVDHAHEWEARCVQPDIQRAGPTAGIHLADHGQLLVTRWDVDRSDSAASRDAG